ncbi:MAG: DUF378 domain-containing protein [Clostridia bacterium]
MVIIDMVALILTIIGGVNWGLVGIFQFDLVAWIFGSQSALLARVVYALVGISAIWCVSILFKLKDDIDNE